MCKNLEIVQIFNLFPMTENLFNKNQFNINKSVALKINHIILYAKIILNL